MSDRNRKAAVTDTDTLVELRSASRTYRIGGETVEAVRNVDLTLAARTFVAVVGPSGAGKSTLLHLVGGLDTPTSGSVTVCGHDVSGLDDVRLADFRLRTVGMIFQSFNLLPAMSAWENVALPSLLAGQRLKRAKGRAMELLASVGMESRAEHRPKELSGGQMQRVAIARALMMSPQVILADEPTGNLDSKTGATILELLGSLAHETHGGTASRLVMMVTHDTGAAEQTDRVIAMFDGQVEHDSVRARTQ